MSSLFSTPKRPDPAPIAVIEVPPPPPAPLPPAPPVPLPTPTIVPVPLPTPVTDPGLAVSLDPALAEENALAKRGRGIQGTITTSLVGVPAAALAGADFGVNSLLPKRKTLLGE
ncbi:MAG: hypothetical protein WCO00_11155 [Rhodospirillaceae bacterium]